MNYNLLSLENNHIVYTQLINRVFFVGVFLGFVLFIQIVSHYIYLTKTITTPIDKLSVAAQEIANGHFDTNIPLHSADELGKLSLNLTYMSCKLKEYYKHLRNEVRQHHLELKRVKEFESQKEDFLSIASHELKTPITSLKIYSNLLGQEVVKNGHPLYLKYLNKIDNQTKRMLRLINGLLTINQMQAGKINFTFKRMNLNEVLQERADVAQEHEKQHQIILQGKAKRDILADKEKISLVIDNLLSNAIKYSPNHNKIIIRVTPQRKDTRVSIRDFGFGISKIYQKKIFNRFYRITEPDKQTFPGLGMGLYLCHEIIKRHKGKIWVESKENKGSVFNFTLPN